MSNRDKRLARLEKKEPFERKFVAWEGNPWTPEQMAEAIRCEPDKRVFWKSLLDSCPCQPDQPPQS